MTRLLLACFLVSVVGLLPVSLPAQLPSPALTGTVVDPSGAPLPRATLRLRDTAGTVVAETLTDTQGSFQFEGVSAQTYTLEVELTGFARASQTLRPGEAVEITLAVAPVRERIVVTATRTEAPTGQVGSSVTVIPAELLESRQTVTLTELLRTVPGLAPLQSGPPGAITSVFARGAESDHNKVFIDGVPVNEPGGAFNFANLTPLNLDRIEVVRGPQSALFGSDALGSTIQLFTRRGVAETLRPHMNFSLEGGTHDTFRSTTRVAGVLGGVDYSLAAARFLTDNATANSAFRNTTLSGNFGAGLGARTSLRLILHGDFGTAGTPGPTAFFAPDPDAFFRRRDGVVNLSLRQQTTLGWRQQLTGAYARARQRSIDPTTFFGPSDFLNDSRRYRLHYQSDYAFSPTQFFTFVFEWERELAQVGLLFPPVPSADRTNFGYVVQYQGLFFGRLSVTAGTRVEDNEGFGTEVVPRLSLAYFLRRHGAWLGATKLKFNFGQGVKEPQLFESLTVLPGRLKPERVRSFDFGFEQRFARDRAKLELNWFDNRFRELIAFKILSSVPFTFTFDNIGRTKAKGAEVALELVPGGGLRALASYTFLDSQVVESVTAFDPVFAQGQRLFRRPKHAASLVVLWDWRGLNLTSSTVFVGRRIDSDFAGLGLTSNAGYTKWDLAGSYRTPHRVTYFVVLENLLNRSYMEVLGFPALKFTLRAGARVAF
ncbi:MAG: TonB-dependent receptor domain-containing protein [Terriglobia bacterium]